jgi:hypothetical protein
MIFMPSKFHYRIDAVATHVCEIVNIKQSINQLINKCYTNLYRGCNVP